MYFAYRIAEADRVALIEAFPPPPGMEAVCDHVTRAMAGEPGAPLGVAARIAVVGRVGDAGNDVLVVTVDGELLRPDGRVYHVTLAVDREAGGKPWRSNDLIADAARTGGLDALRNLAPPLPEIACTLEAFNGEKTPRKAKATAKRADLPVRRTPLGLGAVREDSNDGAKLRTRFRCPDGTTLGVRVVDIASGRVVVDKGLFGEPGTSSADAVAAWLQANAAPPVPR